MIAWTHVKKKKKILEGNTRPSTSLKPAVAATAGQPRGAGDTRARPTTQTKRALQRLLLPPTTMSSSSHVFTSAADGIREGSKRAADAFTTAMGTDTGAFTDVVDGCRYWSGLFCVVVTFCVHGPYLLSMHTFVSLWRRLGRVPTVLAHVGLSSALVSRVSSSPPVREAIMNAFGGDLGFPTRYACVAAGLLVVASIWLRIQWMRDMDLATATGWVGELERGGRGGKLHTSGVYAIVRHPRYAQILVSTSSLPPSSSTRTRALATWCILCTDHCIDPFIFFIKFVFVGNLSSSPAPRDRGP